MQFSLLDLEMNDTCQYELHLSHVINVVILHCENQNTENVILQRDITKEDCILCIIASSKCTMVIMCLKFTYLSCNTAMHVWKKDSWHWRHAKMLDAMLVWLWLGHHRCCDSPEIMIVCMLVVDTLNTTLIWIFIYMIHQNILWNCQCNLMHVTAILWLQRSCSCVHVHCRCFDFHEVV